MIKECQTCYKLLPIEKFFKQGGIDKKGNQRYRTACKACNKSERGCTENINIYTENGQKFIKTKKGTRRILCFSIFTDIGVQVSFIDKTPKIYYQKSYNIHIEGIHVDKRHKYKSNYIRKRDIGNNVLAKVCNSIAKTEKKVKEN